MYNSKESRLSNFGINTMKVVLNATKTLLDVLDSFITFIQSSSIISLNPKKNYMGQPSSPNALVLLETCA
jgi:hypothetical protein